MEIQIKNPLFVALHFMRLISFVRKLSNISATTVNNPEAKLSTTLEMQ